MTATDCTGSNSGGEAPPPPPPPPPIETSLDLWDPFGNPGELRAAADAWDATAAQLDDMGSHLSAVVASSARGWSGQAHDAFASHWQEMGTEVGNGADGMREVATQLRAMADELEAKNDLIQSIYVTVAATAAVSVVAGLVSFGAGFVAGAASVAANVVRAERLLAAVKAFLVASRAAMAAVKATKVGAFAVRFAGFASQGAAVTAAVKQVALEQSPFDPDNWSPADVLGVGAGGFTSAGLALRGARLAGTPTRALASGFAADAGTSALVDVLGGNARPGQVATNAVVSGTTGAALERGLPRGQNAAFGVLTRSWPAWRQRVGRGNLFNTQRGRAYPHNEVPLEVPPGYRRSPRLDSYVPGEEIVSRKHTQLGQVRSATARRYLDNLRDVYPPGARIADIPSAGPLRHEFLVGRQVLEVPPQRTPVPQEILDYATDNAITIRDTKGQILNPARD